MKLFKKTLIILGTLVTIIMLFTLFAINTAAIPAEYEDVDNVVYYFSDFYPSIDKETLSEYYSGYEIVYDHQWLDENTFDNYLGYFYNLGRNCVLILDIKTFKPDIDDLGVLFQTVKTNSSDCTTIFISTYDIPIDAHADYGDFVDKNCHIPPNIAFDRLKTFADDFINHIYEDTSYIEDKSILIDGRFFDYPPFYDTLNNIINISASNITAYNRDVAIEYSVFMKYMLESLALLIGYNLVDSPDDNDTFLDYSAFLLFLKTTYNTNFIIHLGEYYYLDLATLTVIDVSAIDDISDAEYEWYYLYAVSFYSFDPDFYDFLYQEQGYFEGIYVMSVDPLVEGEDGLPVITDHDICSSNTEEAFVCEYLFGEYL